MNIPENQRIFRKINEYSRKSLNIRKIHEYSRKSMNILENPRIFKKKSRNIPENQKASGRHQEASGRLQGDGEASGRLEAALEAKTIQSRARVGQHLDTYALGIEQCPPPLHPADGHAV